MKRRPPPPVTNQQLKELIMTVSAQVQTVLDKVTQTETLEQSVVAGLQAQATQIAALNAKIAALQAQPSIQPDDLAALATIGTDLDGINQGLTTAIPANTPAASASAGTATASADPNATPMTSTGPAIVSQGSVDAMLAPKVEEPAVDPAAKPAT
jgi:hypothetical protein